MTPIAEAFQRLEATHQQFATLPIGDDEGAAQITKQMDQVIEEMTRLPIQSLDDLALLTYAATWGGDQGAFDAFSARMVELVGNAGCTAFMHRRAA